MKVPFTCPPGLRCVLCFCCVLWAGGQSNAEVGLAARWTFDETSGVTAADSSGNGNAGTLTNTSGTVWTAGQVAGAVSLDGVNDVITVPDSDSLDLGNQFTIAVWMKPRSYANFGRIIIKGTTAGSRYDLALVTGGQFQFKSSVDYSSPTGLVALNTWQHVAVTYDGGTLRFYVQGVLKASSTIAISITPNALPAYIGNVSGLARPFDGLLDDLRLYHRALPLAEVQSLAGVPVVTPPYELAFSSYLGGANWEHARDVAVDDVGNVVIVGGTASSDFPTTTGAYSRTYNAGVSAPGPGTGAFGNCDGFVSKFNASGRLVWSTFIGGAAYDRIYAVELDAQGFVYVSGRAGPGFPVTANAFQQTYAGTSNSGNYGNQNGFVAKLSPDGSQLIWATYVGVGELVRDLAVDSDGDVYAVLSKAALSTSTMPSAFATAFTNAVRPVPAGTESGVVKIKADGTQVLWATWLGGSGTESGPASIKIDGLKQAHICFYTTSTDVLTAGSGAQMASGGGTDMFVAKLNASGSALLFGTYLGGSGDDTMETHSLALDAQGNTYIASATQSANWPITPGTIGSAFKGTSDIGLAKIAPDGSRVISTLIGGTGGENPDGIQVDAAGRIFIVTETNSADFPITGSTAHQTAVGGAWDGVAMVLSPDMTTIQYSTYLGGTLYDNGRTACVGKDGAIYLAGGTLSTNWPTLRAFQTTFAGGSNAFAPGSGDCLFAKLCETADRDGDGQTGIQEFIAGTDALNPSNALVAFDASKSTTTFQTTISGRTGRLYILQSTQDLTNANWSEVTRTSVLTSDQPLILTDPNPPSPRCFYRVQADMP